MTRSIHYRQGRFGIFSRIWEVFAHSQSENDLLNKIRNYKSTEIDEAAHKSQFANYIIYGLWKSADHKIVGRWVSGRQLHVDINGQRRKITCSNLLCRVYVRINDKLYFPNSNDGPIRRLIGKSPVRLNDYHQDNMTKPCGYRLKSLIMPFKDHQFYQASIPLSYDASLPNILSNIMNFQGLEKLAMILLEYFNINENLEELKRKNYM